MLLLLVKAAMALQETATQPPYHPAARPPNSRTKMINSNRSKSSRMEWRKRRRIQMPPCWKMMRKMALSTFWRMATEMHRIATLSTRQHYRHSRPSHPPHKRLIGSPNLVRRREVLSYVFICWLLQPRTMERVVMMMRRRRGDQQEKSCRRRRMGRVRTMRRTVSIRTQQLHRVLSRTSTTKKPNRYPPISKNINASTISRSTSCPPTIHQPSH
mmetsp:Transcript_15784/g.28644  ORF Transcript_15784/g.28644 Transcript_15784/m.28644 type:complete len:214 (+) Transcript_15784:77-718(+)